MNCKCVVILSAFLVASGCNRSGLVPAQGRVTLDGQPVNVAMVQFVPETSDLTQGRLPHASTDPDGNFTMTTQRFGDGVRPGNYKVVVTKITEEFTPLPSPGPAPRPATEDEQDSPPIPEMMHRRPDPSKRKSELPAVYANAQTTPLQVEISSQGEKTIELKLSSQGRERP